VNKQEILAFITKNPIGYLGTVDGNAARVRGMDTFRADDNGLLFYTGKAKDVFKQITKNPEVEVCYFAQGMQVRVRGKIHIIEQLNLKKEIVEKRPFLKPFYKKDEDYEHLGLLILKGEATIWIMKQDLTKPKTFVAL
jgi:uncharacterized pyridoxamine 5'-phosphate oxidase family protein